MNDSLILDIPPEYFLPLHGHAKKEALSLLKEHEGEYVARVHEIKEEAKFRQRVLASQHTQKLANGISLILHTKGIRRFWPNSQVPLVKKGHELTMKHSRIKLRNMGDYVYIQVNETRPRRPKNFLGWLIALFIPKPVVAYRVKKHLIDHFYEPAPR